MIINKVYVNRDSIDRINAYDIALFASGYESRARYVSEIANDKGWSIVKRMCFGFKEHSEEKVRKDNDNHYRKHQTEEIIVEGDGYEDALNCARRILEEKPEELLIDITSMTRCWYAAIVRAIQLDTTLDSLRTVFTYAPAQNPENYRKYPPNTCTEPIRGYEGLSRTRPTVLVISLGCEVGRAMALAEEVDPSYTVAVYANPSVNQGYVDATLEANETLLSMTRDKHKLCIPLIDTYAGFSLLESYIHGIAKTCNVVYASLGPKIVGLYGILLYSRQRNMSVWRVSPGTLNMNPVDHAPEGTMIMLDIDWNRGNNQKK